VVSAAVSAAYLGSNVKLDGATGDRTKSPEPTAFGVLLKRLRIEAALSQEELAERATVSVQAIGAYERGERRAPYRETVSLLASALGVSESVHDLMEHLADRRRGPRRTTAEPIVRPNNLPLETTTFVGRGSDLTQTDALVRTHSLVTIVGAGGIGKTRLAVKTASRRLPDMRDGAWFVDLASINDASLVVSTIASTLSTPGTLCNLSLEGLLSRLRHQQLLLVLDGCEHLVSATADVVTLLVRQCPDLRVLVTSREALDVTHEQIFRLAPLEQDTSIRLFKERAHAANPSFDAGEYPAIIAEICNRIDGIALAIELAAARTRTMRLEDLAVHLELQILAGGATALRDNKR